LVLARHETVNKRFKDFGILNQTFRHTANSDPLTSHQPFFLAVAVVTAIKIECGETLFAIYID
jgi:hypothetical protein